MGQSIVQAKLVDMDEPNPRIGVQQLALFDVSGSPVKLASGPSSDEMKTLKARVTKLENRLKELEEDN